MVRSSSSNLLKYLFLSLILRGKNPSKTNLSVGNPDTTTAVISAETPGIGIIFILLFKAKFINTYPGSEIPGIPASETRAIS